MAKDFKLLETTAEYMSKKIRLPVVKEKFFFPTEASVELEPEHPGEPNVIGHCARATYYRYSGEFAGEKYTHKSLYTFLIGKAVEQELIELWKQMGLLIDSNIKFNSKEHFVSGEIDAVITDIYDHDHPIAIEVKTYHGYQATKELAGHYADRKKQHWIDGQPKDAHLLQILIYLHLHPHIFKYGKLVYIDKEACNNQVEFNISLSKEGNNTYPVINGIVNRRFSIEQVYERFNKIKEYVDNKKIPPRDFQLEYSSVKIEREFKAGNIAKTRYEKWQKTGDKIGSFQCNYCPYSAECYKTKE
jgi:hypothetical protein